MILKRQLDGKRLAIPNHREIPKGTLRAIIRQAIQGFIDDMKSDGEPIPGDVEIIGNVEVNA